MAGSDEQLINLNLKVWRQPGCAVEGELIDYRIEKVSTNASFLEMMDQLNEQIILQGNDPVAFDHDCREGICGMCSMVINGQAHGPERGTTTCQLHMRSFKNEDTIVIEPFRATAFPIVKDLVVDRSSFDRIQSSGGFISVDTGSAAEANSILVNKEKSDEAFNAAACIGCGACVASCKNSSAMLFTAAKVSHLSLLPQGEVEKKQRALNMVAQMDSEGFGHCTNEAECEAACPKEISIQHIARLNREFAKSLI